MGLEGIAGPESPEIPQLRKLEKAVAVCGMRLVVPVENSGKVSGELGTSVDAFVGESLKG